MIRHVETDNGMISYEIQRKSVKNLNLRIKNDGSVRLSVPYHIRFAAADCFVKKNAGFIFKAKKQISQRNNEDPENIFYLGQKLPLKIRRSDANRTFCELINGSLCIFTDVTEENFNKDLPQDARHRIQIALNQWQQKQAKDIFPVMTEKAYGIFCAAGLNIPFPELTVRKMKTRWGSCTAAKNKICLNTSLIEKPKVCIEYVICHELAHLIVQNHSKDFYIVLDKVFPDHKNVKKLLNAFPGNY